MTWRLGSRPCWVKWSRDLWRHAIVWRHNAAHILRGLPANNWLGRRCHCTRDSCRSNFVLGGNARRWSLWGRTVVYTFWACRCGMANYLDTKWMTVCNRNVFYLAALCKWYDNFCPSLCVFVACKSRMKWLIKFTLVYMWCSWYQEYLANGYTIQGQ